MCDAGARDAWPYNRWRPENGPIITPNTLLDKAKQKKKRKKTEKGGKKSSLPTHFWIKPHIHKYTNTNSQIINPNTLLDKATQEQLPR